MDMMFWKNVLDKKAAESMRDSTVQSQHNPSEQVLCLVGTTLLFAIILGCFILWNSEDSLASEKLEDVGVLQLKEKHSDVECETDPSTTDSLMDCDEDELEVEVTIDVRKEIEEEASELILETEQKGCPIHTAVLSEEQEITTEALDGKMKNHTVNNTLNDDDQVKTWTEAIDENKNMNQTGDLHENKVEDHSDNSCKVLPSDEAHEDSVIATPPKAGAEDKENAQPAPSTKGKGRRRQTLEPPTSSPVGSLFNKEGLRRSARKRNPRASLS